MIQGLQVTITGEELSRRLSDRIRTHEAKVAALDARIEARSDDLPFDIRMDDFRTVPELRAERDHYAGRATTLSLLRESLIADERYVLGKVDLQLAELITVDHIETNEIPFVPLNEQAKTVDGLQLTFNGEELRQRLADRIEERRQRAEWWKNESRRTAEEESEERPLLPSHMCENEAEEQLWRADVLAFVRDHLEPAATYRLNEGDLSFGELLPEKPGCLQQQEYEERTNLGFQIERLTKRLGRMNRNACIDASAADIISS